MKRILSDPLLQFCVLGGLLFGLDQLRHRPLEEMILVPSGLSPTQQELRVQSEILLREARKRALDQGDSIIDRQLQQKMRALLESQANRSTPDEATLQQWLHTHAERYAEPERLDYEQVFYPRSAYAGKAQPPFTADLSALQQGQEHHSPVISRNNVSHAELRKRFGKTLADAVFAADTRWSGPIQSGLGWHLIRVTQRHAPKAPEFAALREKLTVDWREAERERVLQQELERLATQYTVKVTGS